MAKYTVTHSCGHDESHQIYGAVKGRDAQAARLASGLCEACQAARRAEESAAAASAASSLGLPALHGSDKQIAWAETIRSKAAEQLLAMRATMVAKRDRNPDLANAGIKIIDARLADTSASRWIDDRGTTFDWPWISTQAKSNIERV